MTDTLSKNAPIFLVEDDEVDVEAVRRALKKANIINPVISARDGVEALEMLTGEKENEKILQPCLMLLDINLPRMGGLKLLQEMRNDKNMKRNVVFMLSTSARDEDKIAAYNLQSAGYILKENLGTLASLLASYCAINEFPHG